MVAMYDMMSCRRLMIDLPHMLEMLLMLVVGVLLHVFHMLLHVLEALDMLQHMLEVLLPLLEEVG